VERAQVWVKPADIAATGNSISRTTGAGCDISKSGVPSCATALKPQHAIR
jgi:hypothetical protein